MKHPGRATPLSPEVDAAVSEAVPAQAPTLRWLDALKGIAITAVVLDHAFIIDNYLLWKHLYFSVSWFILLSGVSNTYSARLRGFKPSTDTLSLWARRLKSLLIPYLYASGIAYVIVNWQDLSVGSFLQQLVLFHALPPLYFIALLLQLLVLFPLLFVLIHKSGWRGRLLVALAIVPVASVVSHWITFPWVLGAHYLFGASFLYLFVLGILLEPALSGQRLKPAFWLACGLPLFILTERINIATNGLLMTHPPSNVLVAYAAGLLAVCYAVVRLLESSWPVRAVAWLGNHSLDIFLYHYLFLLPILSFRHTAWTDHLPLGWSQMLLMMLAIPSAIAGSVLLARTVTALRIRVEGAGGRLMAAACAGRTRLVARSPSNQVAQETRRLAGPRRANVR